MRPRVLCVSVFVSYSCGSDEIFRSYRFRLSYSTKGGRVAPLSSWLHVKLDLRVVVRSVELFLVL